MGDLDALGRKHKRLLSELEEVRNQLAEAIRAEAVAGATWMELARRAGYNSTETIRRILHPETREAVNRARRALK